MSGKRKGLTLEEDDFEEFFATKALFYQNPPDSPTSTQRFLDWLHTKKALKSGYVEKTSKKSTTSKSSCGRFNKFAILTPSTDDEDQLPEEELMLPYSPAREYVDTSGFDGCEYWQGKYDRLQERSNEIQKMLKAVMQQLVFAKDAAGQYEDIQNRLETILTTKMNKFEEQIVRQQEHIEKVRWKLQHQQKIDDETRVMNENMRLRLDKTRLTLRSFNDEVAQVDRLVAERSKVILKKNDRVYQMYKEILYIREDYFELKVGGRVILVIAPKRKSTFSKHTYEKYYRFFYRGKGIVLTPKQRIMNPIAKPVSAQPITMDGKAVLTPKKSTQQSMMNHGLQSTAYRSEQESAAKIGASLFDDETPTISFTPIGATAAKGMGSSEGVQMDYVTTDTRDIDGIPRSDSQLLALPIQVGQPSETWRDPNNYAAKVDDIITMDDVATYFNKSIGLKVFWHLDCLIKQVLYINIENMREVIKAFRISKEELYGYTGPSACNMEMRERRLANPVLNTSRQQLNDQEWQRLGGQIYPTRMPLERPENNRNGNFIMCFGDKNRGVVRTLIKNINSELEFFANTLVKVNTLKYVVEMYCPPGPGSQGQSNGAMSKKRFIFDSYDYFDRFFVERMASTLYKYTAVITILIDARFHQALRLNFGTLRKLHVILFNEQEANDIESFVLQLRNIIHNKHFWSKEPSIQFLDFYMRGHDRFATVVELPPMMKLNAHSKDKYLRYRKIMELIARLAG